MNGSPDNRVPEGIVRMSSTETPLTRPKGHRAVVRRGQTKEGEYSAMISHSRESLVEVLRREILGAGKSVFAVAKEAQVSQPILSRFLSGKRGITLATAERLCHSLGLELRRTPHNGPHAPDHFFATPPRSDNVTC